MTTNQCCITTQKSEDLKYGESDFSLYQWTKVNFKKASFCCTMTDDHLRKPGVLKHPFHCARTVPELSQHTLCITASRKKFQPKVFSFALDGSVAFMWKILESTHKKNCNTSLYLIPLVLVSESLYCLDYPTFTVLGLRDFVQCGLHAEAEGTIEQ